MYDMKVRRDAVSKMDLAQMQARLGWDRLTFGFLISSTTNIIYLFTSPEVVFLCRLFLISLLCFVDTLPSHRT